MKQFKIDTINDSLNKNDYVVLFISGSSGSGKTLLANTIAKAYDGFICRHISCRDVDSIKYDNSVDIIDVDYMDDTLFEKLIVEPPFHKKLIRIICMYPHPKHERMLNNVSNGYSWNSMKDKIIRCYTSSELSFTRDVLHGEFGDIVYEFHRKVGQSRLDSMLTRPCMVSYDGVTEISRFGVREGWRPKRKIEQTLF